MATDSNKWRLILVRDIGHLPLLITDKFRQSKYCNHL